MAECQACLRLVKVVEAWRKRESMAAGLFMLSLAFAVMMFARSAERSA